MTNEYPREPSEDAADAVNLVYDIQREVLLEIAREIDERLYDECIKMIDQDGWSLEELTAILEKAKPGSTETMREQVSQHLDAYWKSPEQKKARRRENWRAFVRGLGSIGAGMAAIGEGMSNITIAPRPKK